MRVESLTCCELPERHARSADEESHSGLISFLSYNRCSKWHLDPAEGRCLVLAGFSACWLAFACPGQSDATSRLFPSRYSELVSDVHLSANHLGGSVPAQLGQLAALLELRLYSNALEGSPTLGGLRGIPSWVTSTAW